MSYDETGDLRFFISLVDAGSLSAGARSLGTSPAAASRRLARLETRLGSTLVIRNTRHFGLSETGRLYYERALTIVADIDHLEEEISSSTNAPRGTLSIGAPVELGRRQIAPFIEAFSAKHPRLMINLALAPEGNYDFNDYLDVVLRLGLQKHRELLLPGLLRQCGFCAHHLLILRAGPCPLTRVIFPNMIVYAYVKTKPWLF